MKRCIFLIALLGTCVGAVEITALGGGNYQKWNDWYYSWWPPTPEPRNYEGFGYHAGGLISLRFTKPSAPAFIGLETGTSFIKINYVELVDSITTIIDGELVVVLPEPNKRHFNKIIVPVLLKILVPTGNGFEWGVGIGPAIIRTPSWTEHYEIDGEEREYTRPGETDIGLEVQASFGFKVLPRIWLRPSVNALYNITADDPDTDKKESERFFLFSLGLALKI